MSRTSRRVMAPAVIGVTAAAISQIVSGVAAASAAGPAHVSAKADPSAGTPSVAGPTGSVVPAADSTGCTGSSSPDYGCGKLTVEAQPVAGTFPATDVPDLSGLTFDITGDAADQNIVYHDSANTCTTGTADSSGASSCPESVASQQPSGASDPYATWVADAAFTVALDTTGSNKAAPADALVPGLTGTFPDCTAYQGSGSTPTGCADTKIVPVYGTYHRIGLHLVNKVTHKGVPGITYKLCSPTASAPQLTGTTCPTGSSLLTQATTDAHGKLVFTDVYAGSPNYTVVPSRGARGYHAAHIQQLDVPVVTTPAQSGALVQGTVELAPIKTAVTTHKVTTRAGKKVSLNAFAGASHVVKPLKLIKVGKARHGKVRHVGGKITYKPAEGFTGKDVFLYTIRNGVGVKATGKVVVHIKG